MSSTFCSCNGLIVSGACPMHGGGDVTKGSNECPECARMAKEMEAAKEEAGALKFAQERLVALMYEKESQLEQARQQNEALRTTLATVCEMTQFSGDDVIALNASLPPLPASRAKELEEENATLYRILKIKREALKRPCPNCKRQPLTVKPIALDAPEEEANAE